MATCRFFPLYGGLTPPLLDSGPLLGYGARFRWSGEMAGAVDQVTGRVAHGWGQAPALQASPPLLDSGLRRKDGVGGAIDQIVGGGFPMAGDEPQRYGLPLHPLDSGPVSGYGACF